MKRLKLRKWVKVTLVIIGVMVAFIISNNHYNRSIDKCIKTGHTQGYCETGLK